MGTAGGEREDRGFHIALPAHSTRRWERSCQPSSIHWCMGRIARGSQALLGRCRSLCLCRFLTLAASLPTPCCWRYQPRKHGRGSVLAMQMCMCVCVWCVCVCNVCVECVCVCGGWEGAFWWHLLISDWNSFAVTDSKNSHHIHTQNNLNWHHQNGKGGIPHNNIWLKSSSSLRHSDNLHATCHPFPEPLPRFYPVSMNRMET